MRRSRRRGRYGERRRGSVGGEAEGSGGAGFGCCAGVGSRPHRERGSVQHLDKWRDNREGLRREFDALPDYEGHSGKKIGNVILRVTADGHVSARSLTDTAGEHTGKTLAYKQGQIVIEGTGVIFIDWAEAVDKLTEEYGAYEAGVAKLAALEATFDQLSRA